MSITFHSDGSIVHLTNGTISYVIELLDHTYLLHRYFGQAIRAWHGTGVTIPSKRSHTTEYADGTQNLYFDALPFEYPTPGISASKTSAKPQSGCVMYKVCRSSFPQRTMNFSRSTVATPKRPTKAALCCIRVYSVSAAAMVPAVRVTNPFSPSCSPEQPSKPKKSTDFS